MNDFGLKYAIGNCTEHKNVQEPIQLRADIIVCKYKLYVVNVANINKKKKSYTIWFYSYKKGGNKIKAFSWTGPPAYFADITVTHTIRPQQPLHSYVLVTIAVYVLQCKDANQSSYV